jgi:hypothetical protein
MLEGKLINERNRKNQIYEEMKMLVYIMGKEYS